MSPRRWDLVVAAVELACGLGAAAYLVSVGLTSGDASDRTAFDRAFPFLLAVAVLALLATMAWRSLRRAGVAPAGQDRGGFPGAECKRGRTAGTPRVPPPPQHPPALSEHGRAELVRIVGVLADAGLLAPDVPDPADLEEGVADAGEPVTAGTVLGALMESEHPLDALAFHDGHGEQLAETLRGHVDDLARLVRDALTVRLEHLEITDDRHHLRLRLGDDVRDLDYPGAPKYLSSVVHVAVARAARAQGLRLAWLWVDQGVWITALRRTTAEQLVADLAAPPYERWEWVDEQEPMAAGAP